MELGDMKQTEIIIMFKTKIVIFVMAQEGIQRDDEKAKNKKNHKKAWIESEKPMKTNKQNCEWENQGGYRNAVDYLYIKTHFKCTHKQIK